MTCLAKSPSCKYMEQADQTGLDLPWDLDTWRLAMYRSIRSTGIGGPSHSSIPQRVPCAANCVSGLRPDLPCACKHSLLTGVFSNHPFSLRFFLFCSFIIPFSSHLRRFHRLFKRQAWDTVSIRMNSPLFVLLIVFGSSSFVAAKPNDGICYHKNRVQDPTRMACNPEAEVSTCCQPGAICLSNGLCEMVSNDVSRYWTGTCTDYTWNSPSVCPAICNHAKIRQVVSHHDVLSECIIQHIFDL